MMQNADAVIIGGGITGLMVADELLARGFERVVIFESRWVGYGQSSRNSGGIRCQFSNPANVRIMRYARQLWHKLPSRIDCNVLYEENGYMLLVMKDEDRDFYEEMRRIQNSEGVNTVWLDPDEVSRRVKGINVDAISGANFHAGDAVVHHDAVMGGLYLKLRREGCVIYEGAPAALRRSGDGWIAESGELSVYSEVAVVAAAAHTPELLRRLEVEVPVVPMRRELLVTEPVRHFLDPMLVSLKFGMTLHQDLRGGVVGNTRVPEPENFSTTASLRFLVNFSKNASFLLPCMRYARVLRQWAGTYDVTPDGSPIIGRVEGFDGLFTACGFSGHGFMMAPAVGSLLAMLIETGKVPDLLSPYALSRFSSGNMLTERTVTGKRI